MKQPPAVSPPETSGARRLDGIAGKAVTVGSVGLTLFVVLYLLGAFSTGFFFMDAETFLPMVFAFLLSFTFIYFPAKKGQARTGKLPWYDIIFVAIALAGALYIAVNWLALTKFRALPNLPEMVLGSALILTVLAGGLRVVGIWVPGVVVLAILYTLFSKYLPGIFWGPSFSWTRLVGEIWLFGQGFFGTVVSTHVRYIYLFLVFGAMLNATGAGRFFLELSLALAGRFRGGPAKVAIISSGLFGTMSGSATSNVATTGVVTIPMMKGIGYRPHYAGAVETVASTGGILMPPVMGMTAFLMATFMGVSYWEICIAAIIPALLYYFALYLQVDLETMKLKLKGLPPGDLPSVGQAFRRGGEYLIPLVLLIYFLGVARYSATTACIYAMASLLIVPMFRKETRWTPGSLARAIEDSTRMNARIFPINASAGAMTACLTITGLTQSLSGMLLQLSGGNTLVLLLLVAATAYMFGMALPSIVAYILMSILVIPALIQGGIPLYAAHFFVFYYATSSVITPPVCTPAFVAATIADAPMMRTGFQSMRLGIVVYIVPFAFVYSPSLLLQGPLSSLPIPLLSAVIGLTAVAFALEGYVRDRIGWLERAALMAGGLALFAPGFGVRIAAAGLVVLGLLPQGLAFARAKFLPNTGLKAPS